MLFYDNLGSYVEGQRRKLDELAKNGFPEKGIITKVLFSNQNEDDSKTCSVNHLYVDYFGIVGDKHRRIHRPSTPREKSIYPKGTEIREHRHIFAVSPYDCRVLTTLMGVEITPELLGVNLVIDRLDRRDSSLSLLPENAHLLIGPEKVFEIPKPPIATLVRYVKQQGCPVTGKIIADTYTDPSLTKKFVDESKDNRGVVLSVEYPVGENAMIKPGQIIHFKFPTGEVT